MIDFFIYLYGRVSHGTRGLKRHILVFARNLNLSRLAWDAWIETLSSYESSVEDLSRLAWDAWIETLDVFIEDGMTRVASRMGRVD